MRILLMSFVLSALVNAGDIPVWFKNHLYQSSGNLYYGYGFDDNRVEAIANAKRSIAAEMSTKIESTFVQKTERKGKEGSSQARATLKATSNAELFGALVIEQNQVDGIWYVVVKYEQLSIGQKARSALKSLPCEGRPHVYLEQTPLLKSIDNELSCHHRFDLWRSNGLWYLKSGTFSAALTENEFDKLFATVYDPNLTFNVIQPQSKLFENDVFSFKIQTKKSGFLTLLTVYEDGKVGVLISNEKVDAQQTLEFPTKDSSVELVAGLVTANQATKDLYVVLVSKDPIDTSRFETISNELVTNSEYKFSEVVDLLDDVVFSTLLLRTFPKHY